MATPALENRRTIRQILQHNDLLIAAFVLAIVIIIVIPIPPQLLDLLLAFNLTFSLVVLLTTMFTTDSLQFSVFPSLLLVATLFRLSLNISSTKLILNQASAGKIIQAFGDFVVGGNYVVGFIVFIIITVIQFVVITNGAGRVAEVAARFTLDAMPGKQMSIDADLNAGLISEEEAREKRKQLQREADFYGAMDGASKFVRGDAIAGIVITLINILGGLIIGVWQHGMPLIEALQRYTILTVGDGLVSQLPALLISTATGILVTRASSSESFGKDLTRQLTAFPKVLGLAAGILLLLGLVPGLPTLPFLILAGAAGFASYTLLREAHEKERREQEKIVQETRRQQRQPENVLSLFQVDPLEIEIGYNLIPLTDETQGGDLLDRLAAARRQCATELGIYVRPIRIRDNLQLEPNKYVFKIRGIETASGEILPNHYLAMNPEGAVEEVEGIPTREPTFGLPAWWVTEKQKEQLEIKGFTVVDCVTVLITHLTEFIKKHAHELLGRQEVKDLLEMVKENNSALIEELIPDLMTYGEIQKVLQNLLRERIPIRDLVTILETLADQARLTKDIDYLTEAVRQSLSRTISKMYATPQGKMEVITLHPKVEQVIAESIKQTQNGSYPVLEPNITQKIFNSLSHVIETTTFTSGQPIVLCSSRVRLAFRRLTERFIPNLVVLSYNELEPSLEVESVGTVVLDEN
ncbi:flagellar biosynthesis protein FlhA [Calderihabitans maritimus]|uniref:Flagellar biosynthesis protein FlhA n=1 Tax=Calderihabitans maritimus TaxID=1246530 RepID=A0A1Z5HTT1_9FIRM|nr:flagellar biosynthesis protein FlhA [Calderihabitans maritimus]GAW92934.1 flagellar biosynthesis protein FlhA [Calderihabitans maritimus]